ncbi:unnamed protein product [Microthlaspi erraticum]|uniref:Uncharacterized protein n=1 Tax=Microthlaspi erraticum TaxID=1685480 RepID=A0A6D2JHJ6_9BRAS|nr:unnamed protein product [Microthlaspi erraticum]
MRIEGEKGVKTQSGQNIGRGRAKEIWPRNFHRADRRSSREGTAMLGRMTCATNRPAHARTGRKAALGQMYRNGPTVPVDPGNKRSASAKFLSRIWPTKSPHDRENHRPSAQTFLGQGKSPFH